MNDVMIDLETWGNNQSSVVVQIGACWFDRHTGAIGETFKEHISAESEIKAGFTTDASTLYWWFDQSKEAQESAIGAYRDRRSSGYAWGKLNSFLLSAENIWCHASFDAAIVNYHMNTLNLRKNFKYYAFKDLRTLTELAGVDIRRYKKETSGILHDALDDCKLQVKYAVDSFNKLGV